MILHQNMSRSCLGSACINSLNDLIQTFKTIEIGMFLSMVFAGAVKHNSTLDNIASKRLTRALLDLVG